MSEYRGLVLDSRVYRGETTPPDTLEDESRYGNGGTFGAGAKAPTWTQLPSGLWVLAFTAADNTYIDCGGDASVDSITTDMTLMAWCYPTSIAIDQTIISTRNGKNDVTVPYNLWTTNALIDFRLANGATQYVGRFTGMTVNEWQFIVGTVSGTTITAYRNAVAGGTVGTFVGTRQTGDKLTIGQADSTATRPWSGNLWGTRVLTYALSAAQIQSIFNAERSLFGA